MKAMRMTNKGVTVKCVVRVLMVFLISYFSFLIPVKAQTATGYKFLEKVDLGVTFGTTGVGFDLSSHVSPTVRLRTGLSIMPRQEVPMTFNVQVGDDPKSSDRKFKRMSTMLESLTGSPVVNYVDMVGEASMWNWSVMADIYPLQQNRHWRVTVGFSIGPSTVAKTYNRTESMPSLMGIDIYNNMYNKLHGVSRMDLPFVKLIDYGEGYEDLYTDPETLLFLQKRLDAAGMMGIHFGTYSHDIVDEEGQVVHAQGDEYVMMPNAEHMVKAEMEVNAFKPYLGIGYEGRMIKGNNRIHIGFDLGAMFWGGTPSLTAHDGTDLINDVENITGKKGDYVNFISKLKVMPVANLRISYTL